MTDHTRREVLAALAAAGVMPGVASATATEQAGITPFADLPNEFSEWAQSREEAVCTMALENVWTAEQALSDGEGVRPAEAKQELRAALNILETELPDE